MVNNNIKTEVKIISRRSGYGTNTYKVESEKLSHYSDDELIAYCDNYSYNFGGKVTRDNNGTKAEVLVYFD